MKSKILAICLILIFLLSIFSNANIDASQPETAPENSSTEDSGSVPSENDNTEYAMDPYLINETTSIKSDFHHLGIELSRQKYKNLQDILRSDLISMLYLDSSLYVYWAMPEDTEYQVDYMIINDQKYENGMRVLDTNGNYRKYVFSNFEEAVDGTYKISEVGFQHPEDKNKKIKYNTTINCKMGSSNGQFSFEQQAENNIVLVGMLLESIYQFENESMWDAWNNCWNNIKAKDGDQRSFYYFAFNCFDREIDHYFTPDEITLITIDYTINQYTFFGEKKDYREANLAKKEQKIQMVTPETIKVNAKDKQNSNKHPYEYNTIYKLSEADIKDYEKSENYNTLYTAQQAGFEWVVHFGDTDGYRYAENFTNSRCDIDFTKVEDFSTINMTYTYQGEEYSVPTDTLVDMEVLTKRERDNSEKIIKRINDSIHSAIESLGSIVGNTAGSVLSLPFRFLKGILKNTFIRIITIIVIVLLVISIIVFIKLDGLSWLTNYLPKKKNKKNNNNLSQEKKKEDKK